MQRLTKLAIAATTAWCHGRHRRRTGHRTADRLASRADPDASIAMFEPGGQTTSDRQVPNSTGLCREDDGIADLERRFSTT